MVRIVKAPHWVKGDGSLAHLVVRRWVARAFRRRRRFRGHVGRPGGRRSGARVSGRALHANPKIGYLMHSYTPPPAHHHHLHYLVVVESHTMGRQYVGDGSVKGHWEVPKWILTVPSPPPSPRPNPGDPRRP
eukprot:scaffold25104_cov119-Isochrysis_galbana.AAC.2